MNETVFRLTAGDLAAYQLAVRDRLLKAQPVSWWEKDSIRALGVMVLVAVVFAFLDRLFPAVFSRNLELMELIIGLLIGGAIVLGLVWMSYRDQRRRIARPDGPILGTQTVRLTREGVTTRTADTEAHYNWRVIEAVTEVRGLIILWIEPGAGLAVPGHAFASDAERRAFIDILGARRGEAGLPRVGSFA